MLFLPLDIKGFPGWMGDSPVRWVIPRSGGRNGLFHGQGIYTIASDGYNYVGEYRIGNLWNGIMKEKDGTIDYKVVNWKKIKQ